ncbi:hypothetical protein [Paenibacillus agricola]|uniref:Uncharacterized protein n=1 Tax=Paenibacillus agricola TaxID=2716264 RepID=A0ABX0IZK0_9BACL|nr:hypothetical protein [Paenibacillus agricola]NHN29138.1 hypothetical protein [Paenibacillus agricola]
MEKTQANKDNGKYLFNVDILVESDTNGRALEKLLHILNSADIQDYLVKEGIQLGQRIQTIMRESIGKQSALPNIDSVPRSETKPEASISKTTKKISISEAAHQPIWEQFQGFKERNSLIRLTIVKAMGIKLSIPCRILNVDQDNGNVSVYHVDERQVYLFKINEIDDYSAS